MAGGDVNILLELFARVGLLLNVLKTKAMVSLGHSAPDRMSDTAFKRRYDDSLPTHRVRKLRKVQCSRCEKSMNDQYMPTHMRHVHHELPLNLRPGLSDPSPRPSKRRRTDASVHSYVLRVSHQDLHCPVLHCPTHSSNLYVLRRHFCIGGSRRGEAS